VEGKVDALVAISSAIMRRSVRMAETHLLMKIIIIPRTSLMIRGMISNAGRQGHDRIFKKARNPRYEESNVVSSKIKKHYLLLALSFRFFGNLAYRL